MSATAHRLACLTALVVVSCFAAPARGQSQACCLPDGACAYTSEFNCDLLGGTPWGEGSTCSPNPCVGEACCFGSNFCEMLEVVDCIFDGGDPQGPGTICPAPACGGTPNQACCFPDGRCANLSSGSCSGSGGTPQGAGTSCVTTNCTVPCACRGDLNRDGSINGRDVDGFVDCLLGGGSNCICADYGNPVGVQVSDIPPFVAALLSGADC